MEKRVRKASVALYCFRGAIGKKWGPPPKVVCWFYKTVRKPKILHSVVVWWRALKKNRTKDHPIMALNANLHVAPVNIDSSCFAPNAALRLRVAGYMKGPGQE